MTHVRFVLASLALIALPLVNAQSTDSSATSAPEVRAEAGKRIMNVRTPSSIVAALDLDRNGVLSSAEIANAPAILKALDTNEDGVLSPTELRRGSMRRTTSVAIPAAVRQELASRYASAFNVAFTLDANHDGEIQTMEIANAVSSLKSLDANRDGELTPDELQPTAATSPSVLSE
jgi:hypothetical protein